MEITQPQRKQKMFCISPKLSDILDYLQPFKPAKVAKNCLQMINWHTFDTSVFSIEKKRWRNGIFFLVPFLQVHKKWCQLLAAALQHPKPVPARLSRLKIWPLQHPKLVPAPLSRLKISCDNKYLIKKILILPLNFFFSMVVTNK